MAWMQVTSDPNIGFEVNDKFEQGFTSESIGALFLQQELTYFDRGIFTTTNAKDLLAGNEDNNDGMI